MPSSRSVRLIASLGSCLLSQLISANRSSADTPLAPPARYSECSLSGSFCFTSDPKEGTWIHKPGVPGERLWSLPEWYRVAYLSDDGEHLVTGCNGVNLVPVDNPEEAEIVRFWHRGRLLKGYTLRTLGYQRESLQRTVSHYAWGNYAGFESRRNLRLNMVDGAALVFDVTSGEVAQRVAPASADSSVSKP